MPKISRHRGYCAGSRCRIQCSTSSMPMRSTPSAFLIRFLCFPGSTASRLQRLREDSRLRTARRHCDRDPQATSHCAGTIWTRAKDSVAHSGNLSQKLFQRIQFLPRILFRTNTTLGRSNSQRAIKPDVTIDARDVRLSDSSIGELDNGDLYFLANTGNRPVSVKASFHATGAHAELWDPFTGKTAGIGFSNKIPLDFAPYESRLVFFSDQALTPPTMQAASTPTIIELSTGWNLAFPDGPMRPTVLIRILV